MGAVSWARLECHVQRITQGLKDHIASTLGYTYASIDIIQLPQRPKYCRS
jgi:hypothetical protein